VADGLGFVTPKGITEIKPLGGGGIAPNFVTKCIIGYPVP